jgi:hypothetical protein
MYVDSLTDFDTITVADVGAWLLMNFGPTVWLSRPRTTSVTT